MEKEKHNKNKTRNSAIADKPRDAFVQTQWRGSPSKNKPRPISGAV